MIADLYAGRRVFVTGHTGFKVISDTGVEIFIIHTLDSYLSGRSDTWPGAECFGITPCVKMEIIKF